MIMVELDRSIPLQELKCDFIIFSPKQDGTIERCGLPGKTTVRFETPNIDDTLISCSEEHARGIARGIFEEVPNVRLSINGSSI